MHEPEFTFFFSNIFINPIFRDIAFVSFLVLGVVYSSNNFIGGFNRSYKIKKKRKHKKNEIKETINYANGIKVYPI